MIDLEAFLQELLIGGAYIEEGHLRVPDCGLSAEKLALLSEYESEILRLLPSYSFEMPLSYGQEALWVVHENALNKAAYNTAVVVHLQSAVDKALLRDIFQKIGQRHTALRTTIAVSHGQPKQVIHATQALCFEEVDCSGQSWEMVMQAVEQAQQRPFDLSEGPLWRVTLVTQSPDSQALLLSFHHIIFDGWSIWMLVDEFLALAGAARQAVNLPPIRGTYPQFVQWQREMLDTRGEGLRTYWQDTLGGELPVLDLPTDYRRPKVTTSQTNSLPFNLSSDLRDELRALARREGVSFYTVLLAALQILLARYQQDAERILVGVPTAGREREAFAQTFGYFVNMVVVDATLTNVPFTTFLQQVRAKLLAAIKHRTYPFPWVVKDLQIERDPSRGPIYQASLVVQRPQKLSQETLRLLKGEQVRIVSPSGANDLWLQFSGWLQTTGELDLMFDLMEHTTPEGVVGYIRYRSDLFSESTIERMGQHYQQLLKAVVSDATQSIYQLPLLTEQERHQLLVEWNDTATDYPRDKCIHQLFEQHAAAERSPEAIAVVFGDQQLTYHELNARANQLAHYLIAQGVGPDVLVGICVERSIEMVVGLLGILKAGGAYVPLDPEYPPERLAFMLSDTKVPLLLTQSKFEFDLPSSVHRCDLDLEWPLGESRNPRLLGRANNLAYVMYTSGSTGRPKGVLIEHQNVVRLVQNNNFASMSADEVFLQLAPISFDASTLELWGALLNGAKLVVMAPHEGGVDLEELADTLVNHEITTLWLTAGLFHLMVDEQLEKLGTLRQLLAGGDVLSVSHVKKFLQAWPDCKLINGYGPTENTTFTTCCELRDLVEIGASVPIGKPIANTQVYILDERLQPVPVGVVGQLYAGGAGVARGYLNRPQLTFDAFIPTRHASMALHAASRSSVRNPLHPFGPKGHPGRLYKTGDLCRYLPDGNIEFLGRADYQVKIRGFRIELGEIESVLLAADGVREAVVLARDAERKPGDKRLVAYFVPKGCSAIGGADSDTLRAKIAQRLPDYMIPSAFVELEAMPLTPNGKIDRRALPAPDYADVQTTFVAPRNALEQQVADIWASVLDVEQVGIHDNFFVLGGHSLLATQVISRVRAQLDLEVPLKSLFSSSELAAFARQISQAQESTTAITRRGPRIYARRDGQLPLSFAQRRLWFLDQLEPDSALYNIPFLIRLEGALDLLALEQSLAYLMARHESLRTTFGAIDGEPIQIIHEPKAFRLSVTTVSGEQEARQRAQGMAIMPFDLSEGPLLRVQLLKLTDQQHWLVLIMHHIISDGWSIGVLVKELTHAYRAYAPRGGVQGNVPTQRALWVLPPLPIQYADFAVWQRDYLNDDTVDAQLSFWREQLVGAPAQLSLPTDRPRPSVQTHRGANYRFNLDRELTEQLNQLAQSHEASLFMVLLSGFNVLLSRYSRQTDIVVGTPIANRNRAEIEGLIGFFVNTLVLRTQLDDNPTFSSLLHRVRENTLAAYEHQDLPFEQLVDELQPERSLSYTPLFQVMLVLQNAEMGSFVLPSEGGTSLSGTIDFIEFPFAKFDLTLFLMEGDEGVEGMFEYNTDLFDEATIARMASHFEVLLNSIVKHPEEPVLQLPMLTDAEYHQLVHQFNQTSMDFGEPQTIHAIFEAQVRRTPDAVAVVFAPTGHDDNNDSPKHALTEEGLILARQLTYAELNARANQLAHHLMALGVNPDTLVAIAMQRSLEMVVSLLAVLKAGGAYVPIDPTYPDERINAILADTQASILLMQSQAPAAPASHLSTQMVEVVIDIDQDKKVISRQSTQNPQSAVTSQHLAYVLYTSGSTGRPKGVMIEHRNMVNYVKGIVLRFDLKPEATFALAQSLQFDLGLTMLYPALMTGGRLHILNEYEATDPIEFARYLRKYAIDYLKITPTHLSALIDDRLDIQIALILGGEAADTQWVARLQAANPHLQLFNHFGPTETTVGVVAHKVQAGSYVSTIPIGRPLPNNRAFIFDTEQQPVPIGVPGELYIGGPQLARGYLNRPELTAERFIEHPQFGRLYKTGDLCRWLPDIDRSNDPSTLRPFDRHLDTSAGSAHRKLGTPLRAPQAQGTAGSGHRRLRAEQAQGGAGSGHRIEFIGRIDFQVKIRGFRIELGEIESALLRENGVREAVVLARENDAERGDKRLVAYFVPIGDADSAYSNTLRQQLAQRLPDYMIPSAFVSLESMPLTPNGKLDRRALPAPNYADAQTAYLPPRNALEQQVADIWASLLDVEQIGIYDNFFALGGHSLLATQVISRIRAQLNLEVPLKTLFKAPQLAAFAEHVSQAQQSLVPSYRGTGLVLSPRRKEGTTATIRRVPRNGQLPLSFAQQRLWFINQLEPDSALYNVPTMIRLQGQLDVMALEQTFTYLIARHESLRTTFDTVNGEPIQVIHAPSPFTLPILVVSDESPRKRGAQAQRVGLAEAITPFDLSEGPLLRVQLLKLADEMHWLLLNMHHIISDGWSRGVLVKELTHAYTAYAKGNVPTLPTLPIQYADFAVWQRDILKGEILDDHLSFWREHLTGAPALLELPTDRPRPPVQSHRGAHYAFKLNHDLSQQLKQLAQTHDATLFMVLLSAFKVLLSRYSRQTDIVVGTPIANRNRAEIEDLIGFFANTLALRTELDDNPSFTALLDRVRESTLAAYEHQDLPFEQLVDELQLERTLSYSPLFQVMLVLQNTVLRQAQEPMGSFALPDSEFGGTSLTLTQHPTEFPFAKFDLTLFLMGGDEGLRGILEYSTDLFDESTIARMASHLTVLLNRIVKHPDQPIFQLPLLTEREYYQIVHEWNDTRVDFGDPQTIHALFEAQVERTPNAVALVFPPIPTRSVRSRAEHDKGKQLTYHELNVRANQLAHHLISLGVQADTLVAVAMERSIEMVVSLLAVLKAGGAYVPIDPTYPSERIRYMLTDCGTQLVLTEEHLLSHLPKYDGQYVLVSLRPFDPSTLRPFDRLRGVQAQGGPSSGASRLRAPLREGSWLGNYPSTNPITESRANHLAYVIYTSGSTGQPKGVLIPHKNVWRLFAATDEWFNFNASDVWTLFHSFAFDFSVWELWGALFYGGRLVIIPYDVSRDPRAFYQLLCSEGVTVLNQTPSAFRQLMTVVGTKAHALRYVIFGGEALEFESLRPWFALHRDTMPQLVNMYGITETTVHVTYQPIKKTDLDRHHGSSRIGQAIPDLELYILDAHDYPVPVGVAGELHVGGAGLARGYLNRPQLTAERFIEHPQFGRLYKTGDLCRWLLDGNIEYMGRTDFQVKIRGFRIELGEIENALLAQDEVREAVVLAREHNAQRGNKRLVAYVVAASNTNIDSETLRQRLSQRLPDYMVPSAFVAVIKMPLTPNGKLDRRALPAPDYVELQSGFVAPRNEVEASLADIFAEVLRLPQAGIHDNFFRMGGDSILSIQLVSRAAQQGYTLRVKDVFQHPTIAELATVLATERAPEVHASQEVQIGDAPLLPIQRWFLGLNQAQMHHFNQSFLLMVKQPIDQRKLEAAIGTLLRHHDALRFQYRYHKGWQQQYLAPMDHVPLEVVDLQAIPPEYRPAKIEAVGTQTQASLNPLSGDLMRWVYFRSGDSNTGGALSLRCPERCAELPSTSSGTVEVPVEGSKGYDDRLLIVIHHLAVDGVSWRILLEDLATLLDGGQLPPKTSSYRDWVKALQSATQNGYFDADISQWLDNGSFKDTLLPLDEPDALNTIGNCHRLSLTLSPRQTEQLLRTLPDLHDMTLDAVLLTALTETLTEWSGVAALRVKFESHGRQELFDSQTGSPSALRQAQGGPSLGTEYGTINLNRTVGWFTSVYPLTIPRFDGSAVKRIRYTLDQLRRVTDGGISFGALHDFHPDDGIREQFETLPTAPVVYNYLGQLDSLHNRRFKIAQEFTGLPISDHFQRESLIDSNAFVINGKLHIKWTVSPQLYRETAQSLLNSFKQQLDLLMAEALDNRERVAIPSDFVDANLSREQLESLLNNSTPTQTDQFVPSEDDEEF